MRTYKRKTTRGTKSLEVYELAAKEVMEKGRNYRDVAKEFQLCHVSVFNFVKKKKAGAPAVMGYKKTRLVFNAEQEANIAEYLLKCANIYFGLLPADVKRLAYQCAKFYNVERVPDSWKVNEMAGNDWFTNFMKRNPRLAIRSPEATSLSRATSFNRTNLKNFFEKYRNVLERYSFQPSRIWNVDETGITTVQKPKKIVAGKGIKQVGAVTSAERGVLVTLEIATNAIGNAIPCMFVFPRIRYNDIFVRNGPPECIGVGNQSGWMTQKEFIRFIYHFIHHVKPSKEDPVLLLLENHSSHINVEVVNKAKDNNIVLLSFPPHCSHNLQPLDVGVYGPLKNYISKAQTSWMSSNPGKTMSIYDLPAIVKEALPLALNPMNIINAFKKSGIWPCNEDVFQESDFAPSFVTDRPDPSNQNQSLVENEVNDDDLTLNSYDKMCSIHFYIDFTFINKK
ncbi:uncharacterized protein LOC131853752 [Achroia grisella]|uniref:uncharacterized protein LOC131853752 n=1 Tax=Achroia grisella TaxID=688607 RepID=UPI0027D3106A|nr:uncharacterized protein LOC131853752 [Achroia grisella]